MQVGIGGIRNHDSSGLLPAFSLLAIPLEILTFRWAFRKVRRDGTLGFY